MQIESFTGWHERGKADCPGQAGQRDVPERFGDKDMWETTGGCDICQFKSISECKYSTVWLIELKPICMQPILANMWMIFGHYFSRWSLNMKVGRQSPTSRSWQRWREPLVWSRIWLESLYIATQAWNCEARTRASPWKLRPQVRFVGYTPFHLFGTFCWMLYIWLHFIS